MKKLLFSVFTVVILAPFTSCEKELVSLSGTYWASEDKFVEVLFMDTQATITVNQGSGANVYTGTYTYDLPNLKIVGDVQIANGVQYPMRYQKEHIGVVKGRTMEISIQMTNDLIMIITLKKQ